VKKNYRNNGGRSLNKNEMNGMRGDVGDSGSKKRKWGSDPRDMPRHADSGRVSLGLPAIYTCVISKLD